MLRHTFLYLSRQKAVQRFLLASAAARRVADRFVAGETLSQAAAVARELNSKGMLATLDHLGENVSTAPQAAAARDCYIETLAEIQHQEIRSGISIKLTQLGLDISEAECAANLEAVVQCAEETGSFVRVDMEGSAYTDRTLTLIKQVREKHRAVGAVIQAYLFRSEGDVRDLVSRGITIRLCKGAYNEPPSIAFASKADVDRNYAHLMRILLSNGVYHAIATHDPKMISETCRFAAECNVCKTAFEFQMLYGIRTDLQERLAHEGYRVRVYVPFGREWFAYFMRRLAERPANALFLLRNLLR
ncbi:MAG: proline dehydrogenase family protein [Acidobacteria bacterium]|nr:proline dehydrogenase family protein [Acidobacteriota bacterium]